VTSFNQEVDPEANIGKRMEMTAALTIFVMGMSVALITLVIEMIPS
jgi:hypothetical protein